MTLHDDAAAKDTLISHLERELKNARITLRDQFAMQALNGLVAADAFHGPLYQQNRHQAANFAYSVADAMIMERNK